MKTLAELPVTDGEKAAMEEAKRLLTEKFPVDRVILFGSKARGDDDEESDIDLLVLTSKPVHWRERHKMTDALYALQMKYGVIYSLFVVPIEEWEHGLHAVLPIHVEIDRDGLVL
jgi:predicted nucleotidyltransferase